MSIPGSANPLLLASAAAPTGYQIERSLRFNSADSAYLSRTPASSGNRKTWTWAGWVKRNRLGVFACLFAAGTGTTDETYNQLQFQSGGQISFEGVSVAYRRTAAVYRDPSAWMHVCLAVDTTQSTAANRVKLYVNGLEITTFIATSDPSQNFDYAVNNNIEHDIGAGKYNNTYTYKSNFMLVDIHFIDGQALDPTSFGEFDATTGVWMPIEYTGTYGTNGFHLDFADNASTTTIGYDAAGSNDWTANNLSVTAGAGNDSLVDVPTNGAQTDTGAGGEVRGNYCTWNPLDIASGPTLSNGNLDFSYTSSLPRGCRGTFAIPLSGKWYFETTMGGSSQNSIGVVDAKMNIAADPSTYCILYDQSGFKNVNGSASSYGASYTSGDVIGIAVNSDTGQVTFYKNNSSQGALSLTTSVEYFPFMGGYNSTTSTNFGQRPFAYTAPSGFKALNTANLPAPVVTKPSDLFDVKLYTGNGSTQTISGLGFSPDFIWIKSRSAAYDHQLADVVRGVGNILHSNLTAAESTLNTITGTTSDGFTVSAASFIGTNANSQTFAAWAWDAGSSTVTNTQGSITSSVRANATAGFSIVTYTGNGSAGATVGHGLGVAPQMIIIKNRDAADAWQVYHAANTANPETDYLVLNTTAATADALDRWNDTAPTSTLFTLGDGVEVNTNTEDYVAYCFAGVVGYSSFGSYVANGSSTDNAFVYTGFRPRYVLIKGTHSGPHWVVHDSARDPFNPNNNWLLANSSVAEGVAASASGIDILSNGFKVRENSASYGTNGLTYVWAAFAESPFQYARAR
jgi:hypothetical protein